jgi:recombination protein RecR
MTTLEKLIRHFERFPGIGSRQARRFAFHLLTEPSESIEELAALIKTVRGTMAECASCFRFYVRERDELTCPICANTLRDRTKLLVVERDSDVDALERSRTYDGLYFVLGGTVPLLESKENQKLRSGALKHVVNERAKDGLSEIILGFAVNPDGENTARFVATLLREVSETHQITFSQLGRGLSTGSELEYADPETVRNALMNRKSA